MKTFRHDFVNLPNLSEWYAADGRRHYRTPEGNLYPSITTVLSLAGREKLKEWQDQVGMEEAKRISAIMAKRGSNLHNICENYLHNETNPTQGHMPDVQYMFRQIRSHVDKIDNIKSIEGQLYSDRLRVAGRCDVIASFMGRNAIIDFKTTNSEVEFDPNETIDIHDNKIQKYFLQCYGYREMFKERTNIHIDYGVLIIASMDYGARVFVSKLDKYSDEFMAIRKQYDEENGNSNP